MKQFTKFPRGMKSTKAIKAAHALYGWEPKFEGQWSDAEKELWENTDWKARNFEEVPVSQDTFEGKITIYGDGPKRTEPVTFRKYICPNTTFPPYYAPAWDTATQKKMNRMYAGPMYDGHKHNGYSVHDRLETYELYDQLSR